MCDRCGLQNKYDWLATEAGKLVRSQSTDMPEIYGQDLHEFEKAMKKVGFTQTKITRKGFGKSIWSTMDLTPEFAASRAVEKDPVCFVSYWTKEETTIYCVAYDLDPGQEYDTIPRILVSLCLNHLSHLHSIYRPINHT
jgi:hypothetical protein